MLVSKCSEAYNILSSYGTEASITSNYLVVPDPPTYLTSSGFSSIFNVNSITKIPINASGKTIYSKLSS